MHLELIYTNYNILACAHNIGYVATYHEQN